MLMSFDNLAGKFIELNGDFGGGNVAGSVVLSNVATSENYGEAVTFATGLRKFIWRYNGSTYDMFIDGVKVAGVMTMTIINIDKISIGIRENPGDLNALMDLRRDILSSTTITEQQALDITAGNIDITSLITESNSELFYDAGQDGDVTIIENLGTTAGYDLTTTDVTIVGGTVTLLETVERAEITANKDLSNDFVIVEEETNDDVTEATVIKAVSMVDDDIEIYNSLTEDANLKYDDGANKVRHFELDTVIAGGTNIFLKTTVTKNLITDVHTVIDEYGQVVKVGV
jgi:hypothetical protein